MEPRLRRAADATQGFRGDRGVTGEARPGLGAGSCVQRPVQASRDPGEASRGGASCGGRGLSVSKLSG